MKSESGINQKLKFLYLSRILNEDTDEAHPLTVYDLIEKLNKTGISASRKTLLEDLALLEDYGMPVEKVQVGKKIAYYVEERDFQLAEIKLLADAVSSARFITEKKSREMLRKLEKLAGKYHGQEINRKIHVANRVKSANEQIFINVDALQRAIDSKKKVCFRYFDRTVKRGGKKYREGGRTCSPYALTWNDGNYYLVGKQSKYATLSNFRIDRMEQVSLLDEAIEPVPEDFDLAEYMNTSFSMFSGTECTVTLQMSNSLVNAVTDKFGTDIIMIPKGDDKFRITVKIMAASAFYGWMFQFGTDAEIIAPSDIREEYMKMLENVRSKYNP